MKFRPLLFAFLTLTLLLSFSVQAENQAAALDFENGDAGSFVNSGSCSLSVDFGTARTGERSLHVSQRTSNNWDAADLLAASAGISAGKPFTLSAWFYVDSAESGRVAIGKAGGDYAYLAASDIQGREWTQLTAEATLDTLLNIRFLTDSENYLGVDYYVDDIEITIPQTEDASRAAFSDSYISDFSKGTDGWSARSDGSARLSVTASGSLRIEGRKEDWHSPGRTFALVPGAAYSVSVEVFQSSGTARELILSAARTDSGSTHYENLARGTALPEQWMTLSAVFTAGHSGQEVLYIETANAPDLTYEIRNFTLKPQKVYFGAVDIPSLRETYAGLFDFGTAVTGSEAVNTQRMDFYARQFSIMTPGNELKPDFVIDVPASRAMSAKDPTAVAVHFQAAKPLLDYCLKHGVKRGQSSRTRFCLAFADTRGILSRRLERFCTLCLP